MSGIREDERRVLIREREFQKWSIDNKVYCVPVASDEREEDRLTLQHDLLSRLFGNRLYSSRIPVTNPQKVLECGYGGGDWAVAMAEEYEDCEVTGIDIFPMRMADQPENLTLFGYNLNDRLNDRDVFERNAYDLIHSRFVGPGVKSNRWTSYVRDMKALVRPGGWLQMVEYYPNIQSNNGRLSDDSALRKWWGAYATVMEMSNRNARIGQRLQNIMSDAGFRDVRSEMMHLPIGAWDPDPAKAAIGRDSVEMVGDLIDSLSIWPFAEYMSGLGWTSAQVEYMMQQTRTELRDPTLRLYLPLYVVSGRRSTRG